ncbi:MAG: Flp pilus assembly protein CpaB [Candidatus Hydrogenedentota bacterium]
MERKKIIFIVGIVSVVVAILVAVLIIFLTGEEEPPPVIPTAVTIPESLPQQPPPPPEIVVASRPIRAHTILTNDDITKKVMPKPWKEPYIEDKDKAMLVGRIVKNDIRKGQAVLNDYLYVGEKFAYLIPPNLRAVPIPVTEQISILYMINPGDKVDVLCIFPQTYTDQLMTKILIQDADVLSVGRKYIPDFMRQAMQSQPQPSSAPAEAQPQAPPPPPTELTYNFIVLGVSPDEAEKLVLAEKVGEIRLLLRGEGSTYKTYTIGGYKSTVVSKAYMDNYMMEASKDRLQNIIEIYKGTELKHNLQLPPGKQRDRAKYDALVTGEELSRWEKIKEAQMEKAKMMTEPSGQKLMQEEGEIPTEGETKK